MTLSDAGTTHVRFAVHDSNTRLLQSDTTLRQRGASGSERRLSRTPLRLTVAQGRPRARPVGHRCSPERGCRLLTRLPSDPRLHFARARRAHSPQPAPSASPQHERRPGGWCSWRAAEASGRPAEPHSSTLPSRSSAASPSSRGGRRERLIVSAQRPSSWQHHPGWTTWSERGVIKRCDGSDDVRLWYSLVPSEASPEEDPAVSVHRWHHRAGAASPRVR